MIALAALISLLVAEFACAVPALSVIELRDTSLATQLAVQVCAGLLNRDESVAGAAYTVSFDSRDRAWLADTTGTTKPTLTQPSDFISKCLSSGAAKGYIRYNFSSQQLVVPNIITLAGVLDAVPLEDGDPLAKGKQLVFDASSQFAGFSALQATSFMYDNFQNVTTGMSKMNPGLDTHHHPRNPPLTGKPDLGLADYIVKERLFNFFLNDGCIPFTEEHALMEKMVRSNAWPKPIAVYGYDDTFGVEGDLFEAETTCVKEHNLGQIATTGVSNLAFFSRKAAIKSPLQQNPDPSKEMYNKSKTYLAIVIGDGDNMAFVKGSRRDWMEERVKRCKKHEEDCFPLLWTLSPHTLHLTPDWAVWYYNQSYKTGRDFFVLPPSGDLYAYPSMMEDADQAAFVKNTEADCKAMSTNAVVAWEWFTSWASAVRNYFPRYADQNIVRALFAVNVPFNLPTLEFFGSEHYKVLKGRTVLFRPREWRGSGKATIPFSKDSMLSAKDMAAEINRYEKGTVSHIYVTSDGGANLDLVYDMVHHLEEHVKIVNHNEIVEFALQRHSSMDIAFV